MIETLQRESDRVKSAPRLMELTCKKNENLGFGLV